LIYYFLFSEQTSKGAAPLKLTRAAKLTQSDMNNTQAIDNAYVRGDFGSFNLQGFIRLH